MYTMLAFLSAVPAMLMAQDWDREKFPDYNPNGYSPEPSLIHYGRANTRAKARALAKANGLPDHVNNATTKYFPPVFNQDGGSCGSASRIAYMFTHEINSYRDIDSSTPENNYPTHFVWLLTYGNSSKDDFVTNVGVPTSATYGGRTYSRLFGNQEERNEAFGWMTGYDKWLSAFPNRMTKPTQVPYNLGTPEGRLAAKSWLYNHGGDTSYKAGGLIGLGVASGGTWERIPKTEANDEIGVTNMYYVKKWGTQVDHALTMVGYDDRIEFDLDGNGVYGEEAKDERGAWIIVNSWGSGWCNNGFIYCPYACAGPSFTAEGKLAGFWTGELYHTRKDYRPLRTIKLLMDYTRRSELLLQVGISSNLDATEPDRIISMDHFKYAGDGHSGNTQPAPEVPMLGRWADGRLHTEPMEFGYDLTDLTSGYDRNQPLKYFFIVNTRAWGEGEGHIYGASILDYEYDCNGVETPFALGQTGQVEVKSAGARTIISTIVQGAAYHAPTNLAASAEALTWDAPILSGHKLEGFAIYHNGQQLATLPADARTYPITEGGRYAVSALYADGCESAQVGVATAVEKQATNQVVNFAKSGFAIPDIFNASYDECTIEYYIKPNSLVNYNNMFGPGWGTFYAHCNQGGTMSVGWNTGGNRIDASNKKLAVGAWTHVAIVVKGNTMRLYFGNAQVGSVTSSNFRGIGGFGDLVFTSSGTNSQDASYDEIRIWNRARTNEEIKNTHNREFYGDVMPDGLMAYYKGDIIEQGGNMYLRDCVGGHHALISNFNFTQETPDRQPTLYRPKDNVNTLSITPPAEPVRAGVPVALATERGDAIHQLAWTVPALGIESLGIVSPTLTFPKAGTYDVIVVGTDYEADGVDGVARQVADTLQLEVLDAPALDASFTATALDVPSGDRISFHVSHPVTGYAYEWLMPGAEEETNNSLSTGAVYQTAGTYEVTLVVTSPTGEQARQSQTITVSEVAPEADFTLSEAVVMKDETVRLTSTSRHHPTTLQWTLAGTVNKLTLKDYAQYDFTPTEPGVYNISLKATNAKGTNTKSLERALIVTNADSRNGLTFSQSGARVVISKPIFEDETTQTMTIDWWMNPAKLSDYCLGIGESTSTFMLRTDANGCMYFHNGTRTVKSANGFVVVGQWHHYAVAYSKGAVKFYRDGKVVTSVTNAGMTLNRPATFAIGTSSAEMTGSIDEFRIWQCNLTEKLIQGFCNQPLDDYEEYISGEHANYHLCLYYPCNQSGSDVEDITSNGNTGLRQGFGPDGDAWGLSKGVFCLNFGEKQEDQTIDGIETLPEAVANGELSDSKTIYDLSGRRLSGESLRPGLYIVGGRKVMVR